MPHVKKESQTAKLQRKRKRKTCSTRICKPVGNMLFPLLANILNRCYSNKHIYHNILAPFIVNKRTKGEEIFQNLNIVNNTLPTSLATIFDTFSKRIHCKDNLTLPPNTPYYTLRLIHIYIPINVKNQYLLF